MKNQIIVIHGGDCFETYEDYVSHLKNQEIDFERLKRKNWKTTLGEKLREKFEVIMLNMPNSANARYSEWKIWFKKLTPFFEDEVVLVGHSLGGIFLAKYLSENNFPKRILAIFLIAAPYDTEGTECSLVDFALAEPLDKLREQGGKIFLYHSEDDPVVPFNNLKKYKKALPNATARIFKNREHFQQEELPEIVADIKMLYD